MSSRNILTFGAHWDFARIQFRIEPEIEDGQGQTEWSYVNGLCN